MMTKFFPIFLITILPPWLLDTSDPLIAGRSLPADHHGPDILRNEGLQYMHNQ